MMKRTMTPAEMRERSEMCRRERQHLLRYAIWNSRRIREERERDEKAKAAAAVHGSPTKQAGAASPKRLPLQSIHNTADNSRLLGPSSDANSSDDESSDSSASDADSDDLDVVVDSFSKLNSTLRPSSPVKSYVERLSAAEEVDSSSSEDSDKSSAVGSSSSSDDVDRLSDAFVVDSSSSNDDAERSETEEASGSSSDDVDRFSVSEFCPSSDDSDDSWSDCEDSDDGDGCSCCVISAGRASGYSDKDLAVFFQRVSKRFNAMVTSVHQTRI